MGYKELRPGVVRITLEMPTELFDRLEAFTKAQATAYSTPNLKRGVERRSPGLWLRPGRHVGNGRPRG